MARQISIEQFADKFCRSDGKICPLTRQASLEEERSVVGGNQLQKIDAPESRSYRLRSQAWVNMQIGSDSESLKLIRQFMIFW